MPDDLADTPAERRKRKVRDTIIEAAEHVFAAEGEAGLSMRRLAEKIDYSPAAIYKYFASKDELLNAICEQFFERLLERLNDIIDNATCNKACFCDGLKAYVQTGIESPNHYLMAFGTFESAPAHDDSLGYEAANHLENMIEKLVAAGEFRPVDAKVAAKSVWASLHGMTSLMAGMPDFPHAVDPGGAPITREQLIDFHIEHIYRGLA